MSSNFKEDREKILVCCGPCCLANHSMEIVDGLKRRIEEEGLAIDVTPVVKATGCSGLCEKGPIIKFMPDQLCYYKVKPSDVDDIFEQTILGKQSIERLMHRDPDTGTCVRT